MRSKAAQELFDQAQASLRHGSQDGAGGFHNIHWVIQQAEAASALAPEDPEILLFLAMRHLDNLSSHLAIPLIEEVIRIATRDGNSVQLGRARGVHGFHLFSKGRRKEALREIREAALLVPGDEDIAAFKTYLEKNASG